MKLRVVLLAQTEITGQVIAVDGWFSIA